MGVPFLNSYIKRNVTNAAIRRIKLKSLCEKVIAVDISIYMYKFITEDNLMDSMYQMLSLFKYYNIIPVFVFDGKPPVEKNELLEKRVSDKLVAEEKYDSLKKTLDDNNLINRNEILEEMLNLKRRFVRIKWADIRAVQALILAYGAKFVVADGEADELCAKLVTENKAYACLSEDMDLFIYGCDRVLRYLSLTMETCVLYNFNKIINDLKISAADFQLICVISGTDYNINKNYSNINLYKTINYYHQFMKKTDNKQPDFYDWLKTNSNYLDQYGPNHIESIIKIFKFDNFNTDLGYYNFKYDKINKKKIRDIMSKYGFIFMKFLQ